MMNPEWECEDCGAFKPWCYCSGSVTQSASLAAVFLDALTPEDRKSALRYMRSRPDTSREDT